MATAEQRDAFISFYFYRFGHAFLYMRVRGEHMLPASRACLSATRESTMRPASLVPAGRRHGESRRAPAYDAHEPQRDRPRSDVIRAPFTRSYFSSVKRDEGQISSASPFSTRAEPLRRRRYKRPLTAAFAIFSRRLSLTPMPMMRDDYFLSVNAILQVSPFNGSRRGRAMMMTFASAGRKSRSISTPFFTDIYNIDMIFRRFYARRKCARKCTSLRLPHL